MVIRVAVGFFFPSILISACSIAFEFTENREWRELVQSIFKIYI